MRKLLILMAIVSLPVGVSPAQAGFFLEGLKPFTEEPRCPDPYAMDKTECERPDRAYPVPPKKASEPKPDVRTRTRDGVERK